MHNVMSYKPVKVCLIGCGWIGEEHAKVYKQLQEQGKVEFYTCDINSERAMILAKTYNAKDFFTNYKEVLSSSIDVVDICLPHNQHKEATILAARAKKHILLEKPIAISLEGVEEMESEIKKAGIKFMVAENFRFMPSVNKAKELLEKGEIGEVFLIQANSIHFLLPGGGEETRVLRGEVY